jgi:thioredoxin 1
MGTSVLGGNLMNNKYLKSGIVVALVLAIGSVMYFKFRQPEKMETSVDASEIKVEKAYQTNLPKLIDLGAGKCIPCKKMAPILEELKDEYAGKLDIVFIDVWENPEESKRYGIKLIPTQIFYDTNGKEFFRHEGFLSKKAILQTFKNAGFL